MSKRFSLAIPVAGLVALVAGACAVLLAEASAYPSPTDDAFISYRYARNLVEGLGLVYNPGEYVEGYTNLLWTLLVAGALALDGEAVAAGFWLGQASAVMALGATTALAGRCSRTGPYPWPLSRRGWCSRRRTSCAGRRRGWRPRSSSPSSPGRWPPSPGEEWAGPPRVRRSPPSPGPTASSSPE